MYSSIPVLSAVSIEFGCSMNNIKDLSNTERSALLDELRSRYAEFQSSGLNLDMSRGNPPRSILSMNRDILNAVTDPDDCFSEDGTDCRNYGGNTGIKEMKDIFSQIIDAPSENIIIGGSSSLNLMYDTISRAMTHGLANSPRPWCKEEKVSFICPVPGYDRHYKILEHFGIGMIPVSFTGHGPDMDAVEKIIAADETVKGMWCVPVYSNYTGDVCSTETVIRMAKAKAKAPDFIVMYDNAYAVHDLYGIPAELPSFFDECTKNGNPDRPIIFASTSKLTFAGGGVSCVAFGGKNLQLAKESMSIQLITHDKINQLRHARALKDIGTIRARMTAYGDILRPKFETVENTFCEMLEGSGAAVWSKPMGGYFICFRLLFAGARKVVSMCADAGVKLTPAGAGFPYGVDESDSYIRIAPTFVSEEDLGKAAELLCICTLIAALENNTPLEVI